MALRPNPKSIIEAQEMFFIDLVLVLKLDFLHNNYRLVIVFNY